MFKIIVTSTDHATGRTTRVTLRQTYKTLNGAEKAAQRLSAPQYRPQSATVTAMYTLPQSWRWPMRNPGQVNIASIQDALSHAMSTATTDADRWSLRSDAECHRDAILDALSFIGTAMQDCTTSATPHPFSQADLKRLSGFLISAPYLIQGMSAVIESYEEPATSGEARHV
ncbi:hypothetical protein KZR76_000529 [Salmonella enterica]|nr:hypothetical protein [Salmonella enterica]EKN0899649.1 hypothetical protein [Salmonella enterica]ELF4559938.1 hypothetical protein [Salmonella enterica]